MTLKLAVSRSRPSVPYGANLLLFVAIEYTQHLIEQKTAQEKKLEELRKEVLALKIMKS